MLDEINIKHEFKSEDMYKTNSYREIAWEKADKRNCEKTKLIV